MPIITRFDGGLITGVDPVYLTTAQSSVLLDATIEDIGLQSELKPLDIGMAQRSFYQFPVLDSEPEQFLVTSSANKRSYAEFQGALCYSDGGPVCKITDGYLDAEGEFEWTTLGVAAAEGIVTAKALVFEDIPGINTVVMNIAGDGVLWHISAPQIRYRLVDSITGTVYIHSFDNNTGYARVVFTLAAPMNIYREIVTDGVYTDKYILVASAASSFTDGLVVIDDEYVPIEPTTIPSFSGHRLSLLGNLGYSSPYVVAISNDRASLTIDKVRTLNTDTLIWDSIDSNINLSIDNPVEDISGIASTFVHAGIVYVMAKLSGLFRVYELFTTGYYLKINVLQEIDDEYFKGTTIEHGGLTYMFNPRDGKVGIFDGSVFTIQDMEAFPYAKAEDTIYTLVGDTVYAIINGRNEANIRKIELPSLVVSYVGEQRIEVENIKGLGGSSGCNFTDGEFQVMPIHNGIIKYSPLTDQVIKEVGTGVKVSTNVLDKGFMYNTLFGTISTYTDLEGVAVLAGYTVATSPVLFNERTLTGTFVYNVAQKTADGLSEGPIMDADSNPVAIHKGHIKVDLSGVIHVEPLRLYRTGGYLTRFTMVEDVDPGTLYIDKLDDVTIALNRNGDWDYVEAPPEGLKWLTEHRGMLWGSVGNTVYWSVAGNANSWDTLNSFVIVDREVTGLASCNNGLIVFMRGRIKLITGYSRADFSLRTVTNSKGTIDSHSIQSVGTGAIFFGEDGMCFTDGAQVMELSYQPLGNQDFDVVDSTVTNRSYFALIKGYTNSALNEARVILRYDYGSSNPVFSLLSGDNIDGLGTVFGNLAHSAQGSLFKESGVNNRIMNYRSGYLTEGMPTMIKGLDRVRVSGKFKGTFIVRIDGVTVLKKEIDTTNNIANLHIPKEDNKGKAFQFEVLGLGLVTSIEYSLTPRKTTK